MKYRKKPITVDAIQWFQHGDHPAVRQHPPSGIVGVPKNCGWIETLEGGYIVQPGDWIITGVLGEHYPCKPEVFEQTYEPVENNTILAEPQKGEEE